MEKNLDLSSGYSFRLTFDSVFNHEMIRWLEANVGMCDNAWGWQYTWLPDNERFEVDDNNCIAGVIISFSSEKHATLFYLRWTDECLIK